MLLIATLCALLHYRASFNHLIASARQWDPYAREIGTNLIPHYRRFSQTELVGFIFPTIVDKTIDKTIVNDSRVLLLCLVLEGSAL